MKVGQPRARFPHGKRPRLRSQGCSRKRSTTSFPEITGLEGGAQRAQSSFSFACMPQQAI